MNRNTILAVAVALVGSAIFGCIMAFRPALPESWMRTSASAFAFATMGGAFLLALKLRNDG